MPIPSYCDSFMLYDTSALASKYLYITQQVSISTTGGRNNGRCLSLNTGTPASVGNPVPAGNNSINMSIRFKSLELSPKILMTIRNITNSVHHLTVLHTAAGRIEFRRGDSNGTLLATSSAILNANILHSLSIKYTVNSSTGSFSANINGTADSGLTASGVNTQNGASSDITSYYIGSSTQGANAGTLYVNDFVVRDGSFPLLGDLYVDAKVVTGPGTYQQFTPSTGTNHAVLLDEIPPNTTDFVSSNTTGHRETNTISPLTGSPTIVFVQATNYMYKSDAGTAIARTLIRSGAVNAFGDPTTLVGSPSYYTTPFDTDPATSVAWTVSGVNAVEVGIENAT